MPYAGDFNPGDAVRIVNYVGVDMPGLPRPLVGKTGVVVEPTPRILAQMVATEVPVSIAFPHNERANSDKEVATYLLFPEYLEKVKLDAAPTTRKRN